MEVKVSLTDIIAFYRSKLEQANNQKFSKEVLTRYNLTEGTEESVPQDALAVYITFK